MSDDSTLADLLDEFAEDVDSIDAVGGQTAGDAAVLRRAGVRLRKLDAIEAAVGDVDVLRRWVDDHNSIMLRKVVTRIADAVEGGT